MSREQYSNPLGGAVEEIETAVSEVQVAVDEVQVAVDEIKNIDLVGLTGDVSEIKTEVEKKPNEYKNVKVANNTTNGANTVTITGSGTLIGISANRSGGYSCNVNSVLIDGRNIGIANQLYYNGGGGQVAIHQRYESGFSVTGNATIITYEED